ncbi:MAG: glycosyltransferase family 2 protein [Thermoflexibacteraceae bacterium]
MKTKTAVVILNYNGKTLLEKFLPSVLQYSPTATVIVADNGSTDDSLQFLATQYPSVPTIALPENYGFAKGYNKALEQVEADYYILLNSDVEVTANWLLPVEDLLDKNPEIVACQPKIRAYRQPTHFEYAGAAGGFIDYLGFPFCRGRIFDTVEKDEGQYSENTPIFWATGACLCIRAATFRQYGGFDADFFAHMEEIDLCWRLKNGGHQIYYCADSTVFHVGGATLDADNPRKTYLNFRNCLVMLYKNLPDNRLFSTVFTRLCLDGIAAIHLFLKGKFWAIPVVFKAHWYFYLNYSTIRQKRKQTQAQATQHQHQEMAQKSIVWQYFVQKAKIFTTIKFQ